LTGEIPTDLLLGAAVPGVPLFLGLALWWVRRESFPLLVAVALLATLYVAAIVLVETDYRDADGYTDCWPSCSALQDAVGLVFWLGGWLLVLSGLFSLSALLVLALRRRRGNRAP
jgi:hypothetical protein